MDQDTTVKTPAADVMTDIRMAHNAFAVAVSHYSRSQSTADWEVVEKTRARIYELEQIYKDGRMARFEAVCRKQTQRSPAWIIWLTLLFGRR